MKEAPPEDSDFNLDRLSTSESLKNEVEIFPEVKDDLDKSEDEDDSNDVPIRSTGRQYINKITYSALAF